MGVDRRLASCSARHCIRNLPCTACTDTCTHHSSLRHSSCFSLSLSFYIALSAPLTADRDRQHVQSVPRQRRVSAVPDLIVSNPALQRVVLSYAHPCRPLVVASMCTYHTCLIITSVHMFWPTPFSPVPWRRRQLTLSSMHKVMDMEDYVVSDVVAGGGYISLWLRRVYMLLPSFMRIRSSPCPRPQSKPNLILTTLILTTRF